jgi:phage terminase small subunit
MSQLEPKQEMFCREYIIDLNATQAAIRAGYSEHTARQIASELLSKPHVQAEIQRLADKRAAKLDLKAEDVLREVMRLAMVDISEAFNEDGSLKPIKEIPVEVRRAIASVEVDELFEGHGDDREQVGYTRKVKFWDKVKTLQLLGQHLKLFSDRLDLTSDGKPIAIQVVTNVPQPEKDLPSGS